MSGESSKRSNLVDVTYQQLHSILSGHLEGTTTVQISEILRPRFEQLRNVSGSFGKPSDASRKKFDDGSVPLADGVVLLVDDIDKDFVFAISDKFQVDQVQAFVLLRSFLYNEGLPANAGLDTDTSLVEELLEAITPFYYSERLSVLRVLIPLFRANENIADPVHEIAAEVLSKILPDGRSFAESLITEYMRKTKEQLPDNMYGDPRSASRWVKQNTREQLVMLEVLFWIMWGYVSCDGALVVRIFEAAYDTALGFRQQNANLLLDDEGTQLQRDISAIWTLITIEVLELERVAEPGALEISADPADKNIYTASPTSLKRIHELVTSNKTSNYACTYLAWAFVVSRLTSVADSLDEIPDSYRSFFESLLPHLGRSYAKNRDPTHVLMSNMCLAPEAGLFDLILSLLTTSPLFVTATAWRTGSTVTDPNAIAFRSVFKGLLIALVELVPVERIPDFPSLVEVWIALFGRSESKSVSGICRQFWQSDWKQGIARRAIFDVARSRFPIHFRPLIRLLRSMTAAGFLDTDPLSTADHSHEGEALDEECDLCGHHVFNYFDKLPTLSQVIPAGACKGTNVLYERRWERHGTPTATSYLTYFNVRPIKLPGGTTLPVKTTGRLLSDDGGEFIVLCWKHEHSGWKLILEVLTDYVNRRRMHAGTSGAHQDVSFGRRSGTQPVTLRIEDVGVEMDDGADQDIVKDSLDLVRSVIQGNAVLAEKLLESLEAGDPVVAHTMTEAQPPDLVQLTTMILEEALSRSATHTRSFPGTELITSAMSVLSALLAVPRYSSRVWLYIRSTTSLFGSDRAVGFASVALAAERATGHYTMTLALLHLVQRLFQEASSSVLTILPDNPRLQQIKEEVLLRAYRFVHSEIWVEYLGWKYAQLGDRFEIGRRVASLYTEVLKHAPLTVSERGFVTLSQAVADLLLHKATTSTINPLVSSITAGGSILRMLYTTRRHGDARRLIYLLESHLRLIRLVLYYKQRLPLSPNPCLLEQALCARVTGSAASFDGTRSKVDPIDVLATYAKGRDLGNIVPLEAMHVLYALCVSLSSSQPSPPTIIGHLSDPEATVTSLVRIIQHPYDELSLRNAVWNFISLAVDREPALASLFVTGQFRLPSHVSDERKLEGGSAAPKDIKPKTISAIDVANDTIANWKKLWELNPQLLASVLRFLDVVWQHGLEHKAVLENSRKVSSFWDQIASIASEELGPVPDYRTESYVLIDGIRRSHLHEAVSTHAYRVMVKSYALHIIGQDIGIHLQSRDGGQSMQKPLSYLKMERHFKLEDQLTDLISEAVPSSYDPRLYDELMERIKVEFPALNLEQLRSQEPAVEQEFGDDFAFSISLLQCRLQSQRHDNDGMSDPTFEVEKQLHSLNMNLSLAHSQTALAESWQFLLRQVVPYVRGDSITRPIVLGIAASISFDIASEKRSGDMMATIHGTRLSLLVALLEVVWFSTSDTATEIRCFIDLVNNVHGIILSEPQAPSKSFLGAISVPFHRTLLQTIYFCSRHSRSLARRPKALTAENRLTIASMLDATLGLVIDALGVVFNSARSRADVELDRDMELLVAVFQQCTRPDINPTSTLWLARCQEADVIKASLDLLLHADLTGLSDLPFLLSRRQPLYSPHILMFHMALGSIPSAAERLASEGVLAAYCNNSLSPAISTGQIDIVLPELPGERSPAHRTYCSMLAIVAGVVAALGRPNHYFNAEASGFVQLYGDQIFRALSWTIEDPITFPLLEEIEQVINLFYCIAESTPTAVTSPAVETVLGVFTTHALMLLQQLNYALTHPNHLASLLEPVTADERVQFEKESLREKAADPLVASLVRRLLKLSSTIVSTLISISRADVVLTAQQEDWPVKKSLVIPHSKVVLGEPASVGTLLELGNYTLDVLRDLLSRPAEAAMTSLRGSYGKSSDVRLEISTARHNLEAILVYAITQLAMWLSAPHLDNGPGDMDIDEQVPESRKDRPKERKASRPSLTLTDRLRRGMTGEVATDLQSLLNKAKSIFIKCEGVLETNAVDLTQVLSNFLHERIVIPT